MTERDPLEQPEDAPPDQPETEEPETEEPETEEPEDVESEGRRYPSTIGGLFYLLVLAATGVGLVIAWREDWRFGIRVVAGALAFAAVCRLVLPSKDAGMLAVRHRLFDVVLLGSLSGLLVFLSVTIPD